MPDKSAHNLVLGDIIHLDVQGEVCGPFTQVQVKDMVKGGLLGPKDRIAFVSKNGPWVAISTTSLVKYIPKRPPTTIADAPITPLLILGAVPPAESPQPPRPPPTPTPPAPAPDAPVPAQTGRPPPTPATASAAPVAPSVAPHTAHALPARHSRAAPHPPTPMLDQMLSLRTRTHLEDALPGRKKRPWLPIVLLAVGLTILGTGLFLRSRTRGRAGAPPHVLQPADLANGTYDLMMRQSAWSQQRTLRLRLQPDRRIYILESVAPLNTLDTQYYRWSCDAGELVFWTKNDQPLERYRPDPANDGELAAAPAPGVPAHRLVRAKKP